MGMQRRTFLGVGLGAGVGVWTARAAQPATPAGAPGSAPAGAGADSSAASWSPVTDPAVARQVVGLSHRDLDGVRAIVDPHPELASSAIDWGFGDWESAIGAASHVGRRDIVEYLMSQGARPDLFTLAMLGNLDAVRAMVEAAPGLQRLKGPHGLTLAHHARAGGEAGAAVLAYLEGLEGADEVAVSQPLHEDQTAAIIGAYQLHGAPAPGEHVGGSAGFAAPVDLGDGLARFEIAQGRRAMEFRGQDGTSRNLIHVGGLAFHPAGAPSVRLVFTSVTGRPEATLTMGGRRYACVGVEG